MINAKPSVAICFSGLPRLIPRPLNKWQEFIRRYKADVFIHTWEEQLDNRDQLRTRICNAFHPKSLLIEKPRRFNIDLYKDSDRIWPYRSHPSTVLSMWHSIGQSIKLCEDYVNHHGRPYDIICRARFDWWCENIELKIRPGLTVPNDPTLAGHRFNYCGRTYTAFMDQFGYGNMQVMKYYALTLQMIPTLFMDCGVDFCSELLLTANMIHQNIPVHYVPDMNFRIER